MFAPLRLPSQLLTAWLVLGPADAVACECPSGLATRAPGGEVVAERPVFYVDLADAQQAEIRVRTAEGRPLPIRSRRYSPRILKVQVRTRLAPGTRVEVAIEDRLDIFVVGEPALTPLPPVAETWRYRNENFCGEVDLIGVAWSGPAPGLYAVWFTNSPDGSFDFRESPAGLVQSWDEVVAVELHSCWGGTLSVPEPWIAGVSKMALRRLSVDGALEVPIVVDIPEQPELTHSGIN